MKNCAGDFVACSLSALSYSKSSGLRDGFQRSTTDDWKDTHVD